MGHAVEYETVKNKSDIIKAAKTFAYYNVDPGENPGREYHGDMTIVEDKICDTVEDADEYLKERFDHHDYRDGAVRFHDTKAIKKTKKMEALDTKARKLFADKEAYIKKNRVQNRKSDTITCPKCGSRLNLAYFNTQKCPLCGTDLRSNTVQNRIKKFEKDIKAAWAEYRKEERKLKTKAPIKWRVKVEVHC